MYLVDGNKVMTFSPKASQDLKLFSAVIQMN
jgi:hypothetical protein